MSLCILTNTTALFPSTAAASGRLIQILPLEVGEQGNLQVEVESFSRIFNQLEQEFNAILVLTASETILPGAELARLAVHSHGGTARIAVLDTLQIGPGLGILAQLAARKAAAGLTLPEVVEYLRTVIPHLFTIICPDKIPAQTGAKNRHVPGQPGDPVGAQPVYILDEGQLVQYKKVRTLRHLHENLQEFMGEFEKPQRLAYFHGKNASLHIRPLREAAAGLFPGIQFSDLEFNNTLTALFGEHTVGLTILEMPGESRI